MLWETRVAYIFAFSYYWEAVLDEGNLHMVLPHGGPSHTANL